MNCLITLVVTLSTFLVGCKKDNQVDPVMPQLTECHYLQNPDSASLRQNLVGKWQWKLYRIGGRKGGKTAIADKVVIAQFNENGTYTITENSIITSQGTWKFFLYVPRENAWAIDFSGDSRNMDGIIYLCGDHVIFNYSVTDRNDNLFERIK